MDAESRPNSTDEKARYLHHQNDVDDLGYQQFSSPITSSVLRDFSPEHRGLDFGAGTGPVIAKLLTDNQFNISLYDPFFHNHPEMLEETYDYIVCCEVIEHFYTPPKEFALLKRLLKPNGKLYCMTDIYHEGINFKGWHYKSDPTHVFFYHQQSLEYIEEHIGFSKLEIDGRLITFSA
jgi:2-polyprenyl-3-methyl-5-hydroxy-6-metoxy-1,4-benzoquinol methylase